MMRTLFYIVLGYLSGSVLYARVFSEWLGKDGLLVKSKDGNPGTANAFQYGGFWCGVCTLLGDVLKGFFPVWLFFRGVEYVPTPALIFVLAAPVLGHSYPIFYHFRGGKGIAVTFGCLLGLMPLWQPFAFLVGAFLLFSLIVRVTPHFHRTIVSYLFTLICLFLSSQPPEVAIAFLLITCVVCLRLHASTEPREAIQIRLFSRTK